MRVRRRACRCSTAATSTRRSASSRAEIAATLTAATGLSAGQAEAWADALALRDQQLDDRRSCIECRHYVHSWRCAKRQPTLAQLQRCPSFKFATP